MLGDILLQVNKPGRYIGREWNLPKKDFNQCGIKFALCFPDLYELGMSNLGVRIIYGLLNSLPDVACERFFSLAPDMEEALRRKNIGIFSLETQRGLREFDLVGFSLGYELGYTNVLTALELGAVPLKSSLRNASNPLVIAGGPCTLNPEPMHEFFDLFVIGEAEEVILEIIGLYRKFKHDFKAGKISRQELLLLLSGIEGVYVPSLYEVSYKPDGGIEEFKARVNGAPIKVRKRFIKNLDSAYFPVEWLVPYLPVVHDRITLEIMRGCPNRCRFCQARYQYFPFRQREIKNILNLADQAYRTSGYEEISLCGLSASDFSGIADLTGQLLGLFKEKAVGISLPSIKPKAMLGGLFSLIATVKKTGLTFAPEAGSERMRRVLNKDFELSDFFAAITQAYAAGYQNIKLYFMIGLPGEEEADLDAIIDLVLRTSQMRKRAGKPAAGVNISINALIPKPHTPFQWLGMEPVESIEHKQGYLRRKVKECRRQGKLKLNVRKPEMSFLEGVLCRGDRRLSEVILSAFRRGARFDAWDAYFDFGKWQEAFSESGIDPDFYLRKKPQDEFLPWDFLDLGVNREGLMMENDKVIALQ